MVVLAWPDEGRTWVSYARDVWKAMGRLLEPTDGRVRMVCHLPATRAEVAQVQRLMAERHIDSNWFEGLMTEAEVERMLDRARRFVNAPTKGDLVRLKDLVWEAERLVDESKDDDVAREWYLKAMAALEAFGHVMVTDRQVEAHAQLLARLTDAGNRRAERNASPEA